MNFEQALDILNRWPPDEEAPLSREQEEALRMLEGNPELERALRQRDAFGERVSWVMSDVPCGAGLKFRIHDALERSGVVPAAGTSQISRRSVLLRTAVVAASVAVMAVALWFLPRNEPLSFADIKNEVPLLWQSKDLPEFPAADAPRLPDGGWLSAKVSFSEAVGRYQFEGRRHEIAVRHFTIRSRQEGTVAGMLLALPVKALQDEERPDESDFFHGLKDSIVNGQTTLSMVSWSERDYVYVCLIPSGPAESALQDALRIDVS